MIHSITKADTAAIIVKVDRLCTLYNDGSYVQMRGGPTYVHSVDVPVTIDSPESGWWIRSHVEP